MIELKKPNKLNTQCKIKTQKTVKNKKNYLYHLPLYLPPKIHRNIQQVLDPGDIT